jgi:hypothetical protein
MSEDDAETTLAHVKEICARLEVEVQKAARPSYRLITFLCAFATGVTVGYFLK